MSPPPSLSLSRSLAALFLHPSLPLACLQTRLSHRFQSSSAIQTVPLRPSAPPLLKPRPIKPPSPPFNPLPILKQHASNVGFIVRVLATNPKQIAKLELKRWLKKQVFDHALLDCFVRALQQPDWAAATAVIDRAYDADHSWPTRVPASLLAELATKRLANQDELYELLTIVGHRITEEDDIHVAAQLLNGALEASLAAGNLVVAGELVDYAIRFATEIARVETEKQFYPQPQPPASLPEPIQPPPDPTLALRPLVAAVAGLMSQVASSSRAPVFRLLGQLIDALLELCGSLESVLSRLSKPNVHLVSRAMISSALSPAGHALAPGELALLLKQDLPVSTLRLAMVAMVRCGERERATEIEAVLRAKRGTSALERTTHELDLALHAVRRCKLRAYAASEKLHRRILARRVATIEPGSVEAVRMYTAYMSALFRHHLPKMALEVWERMLRSGVVPDAAAVQVAMAVNMSLGRPLAAVHLFNRFACPRQPRLGIGLRIGSSTSPSLQTLATYARALDLAGRPGEMYALWTHLAEHWLVEPDERIFGALVSSARKLTLAAGPAARSEDCWDNAAAGEVAMRLFWRVLYQNWPALAETVRAPVRVAGLWPCALGGLFGPRAAVAQPRTVGAPLVGPLALARTVMPSLAFTSAHASIVPTRSTFRDMIELLGAHDQPQLVPLLLAWMRALRMAPDQDSLIRAYFWIFRASGDGVERRSKVKLDKFVEEWVAERWFGRNGKAVEDYDHCEGYEVKQSDDGHDEKIKVNRPIVPDQEMIENHYRERLNKWNLYRGYFFTTEEGGGVAGGS